MSSKTSHFAQIAAFCQSVEDQLVDKGWVVPSSLAGGISCSSKSPPWSSENSKDWPFNIICTHCIFVKTLSLPTWKERKQVADQLKIVFTVCSRIHTEIDFTNLSFFGMIKHLKEAKRLSIIQQNSFCWVDVGGYVVPFCMISSKLQTDHIKISIWR